MNVFADIDSKATAKNVDNLLKNKLPRLTERCGCNLTDLSSPKLSLAPVQSSRSNYQEHNLIDSFGVSKVVEAIYQTMNHCSDISKKILIANYIKYEMQERIIMELPYERSHYFHVLKPKSLNEFADRYDYWQRCCKVDDDDIVDLHIYK